MLLVRWPPGCEYASAYPFDRPHSFSTCSKSHADIPCRRAHSRNRRSRCAKPRRDGARYDSQTRFDSQVDYEYNVPLIGPMVKNLIKKKLTDNLQATMDAIKRKAEEAAS